MGAWIAVAIGGALGSVARHGLNHVIHSRWLDTRLPVGTVAANIVGCFLVGLFTGMIAGRRIALPLHWREFVFVGVLGGFTTFSTFGLDTYTLARSHSSEAAAMNVAANMIGGLAAVWIGYAGGVRV